MEFGLDKCAKIVLEKEKLVHLQNLILCINREIQELEQGKPTSTKGLMKVKVYNINK
jgi:hypothetical protein